MKNDVTDKMLVVPERGLTMIFFGDKQKIEQVDLKSLEKSVLNAQYGEFQSPDGFNCSLIYDKTTPDMRMILMKGIHPNGDAMIRSEFRPMQLASMLESVPQKERELVKEVLKNHLPEQNSLTKAWLKCAPYGRDHFLTAEKVIDSLPDLKPAGKATFSAKEAFGLMQAEYGRTKHDADRPVLASRGVGPCVGLGVYNPKTKEAYLCHIDDMTDLDEISANIFEMRESSDEPLEAHMFGGWSDTRWLVAEIALRLREQPNIEIMGWDQPDNINMDVALDSRDGKFYLSHRFGDDQIDKGPMVQERENRFFATSFGDGGGVRPAMPSYLHEYGRDMLTNLAPD